MSNLVKIDELVLGEHGSLSASDECYYLLGYTARKGYGHSTSNDLIQNLKKTMDRSDKPEWKYKAAAIQEIAAEFALALPAIIDYPTTTLIPIPPSKTRAHPLYDDRMLQILQQACPPDADVRELIVCSHDRPASHESTGQRPSVQEILDNYILNEEVDPSIRENVVLFDDLVTGGNHYRACKTFIEERYPATKIIGVFVARRAVQKDFPFEEDAGLNGISPNSR